MKTIEIALLNKKYSFVTDESEEVLVGAQALLQNALETVLKRSNVSPDKATMCVALQLAAEVVKSQEEKRIVDEQIKKVIALCE